jgi:hypothetical protein
VSLTPPWSFLPHQFKLKRIVCDCLVGVDLKHFSFIFAIGITLTLPYFALGAARSFGGSGRFRGSTMHRQDFFTRPFNPFGFVGGDELGGDQVIIIQQFLQPAPATEPSESGENRIYVQPQWVDGGYGVQVLKPGYWTDSKQAAEH